MITFGKYCKVNKCSGKKCLFHSKYCKLEKSSGRKVGINEQYLWSSAQTAQIWEKNAKKRSFLPKLDGFRIRRDVLERVCNISA